jgi:hypothetical protein
LNDASGGFLFRHGWVAECLVGLLKTDPQKRLSVIQVKEWMETQTYNDVGKRMIWLSLCF